MNLEPSDNTSIYGFKYFFNEIIELYNNGKMPNKILLSGKKGSGKSTFNNQDRFIMIDNVEYLNKNSINALLKIIEEPNENIYFILIANSEKNILPTLKSRCITFKIHFSFDNTVNICNQILNQNILNELNYILILHLLIKKN